MAIEHLSAHHRFVARLPRSELPEEGIFHVGARGAGKIPIFLDDEDRRFFLLLLGLAAVKFDWRCYAFCLMGNHYHLVVESRREELSAGMQLLNGDHAQTFNHKYGRWGHLFGDRYSSRVVDSDEYLAAAIDYVLFNPVRAGLCARPEEWPWNGLNPRFADVQPNTCSSDDPPIIWIGYGR